MTEAFIFVILFFAAFFLQRNWTYLILFFAAAVNVALYPFTNEYSVVLEGALDLSVLFAVLLFGDKHRLYQAGLLLVAILLHFKFELDQLYGTDTIFSIYGAMITGVTIMQLMGAGHGYFDRLFDRLFKRPQRPRDYGDIPHRSFGRSMGQILWKG